MSRDRGVERFRHRVVILVRAASRLGDHLIDDAQPEQIGCGQAEHIGRIGGTVAIFPEDRRTPLRCDDGVAAEFEHQNAVGEAESERAARPAFAGDRRDHGDTETGEDRERGADGLALSTLLGADAGVRAGRVDEREDGQTEAVGHFEETDGFAVAFGVGHAEVAGDVFAGGAAFLVPHDDDAPPAVLRQPADDRGIVGEAPVAVQLDEVGAEPRDVVHHVRALSVPRNLDLLHRGERAEELARHLFCVLLHAPELLGEVRFGRGEDTQLTDTIQELDDGGFEGEDDGSHADWLEQRRGAVQAPLLIASQALRVTVADAGKARHAGDLVPVLVRPSRVPVALPALVIACVVIAAIGIRAGGFPGAPFFSAVSDDDFARVTIAQRFAHAPRLDPTGTSWLPFPFWVQGAIFTIFGRSLAVAQATALVSSGLAAALITVTARLLGLSHARSAGLTALCFLFPVAPFLAAATVPEVPTAGLIVFGVVAVTSAPRGPFAERVPFLRIVGQLALLAATLSRYETWPMAAAVAANELFGALRHRQPNRAGLGALALAGPTSWLLWNLHAHGDALSFLRRVAAFRAHHLETTGIFSSYPLTFLRDGAVVLALGAVALAPRFTPHEPPPTADDARSRSVPVLLAAALASFLFLVGGDFVGGAPTHHPERALLPAFVALLLGVGALRTSPFRRSELVVVAAAAIGIFALRSGNLTDSFPDRRTNLAEGRTLRALVPAGERVAVIRDSYATEATRAAFQRAEDLDTILSADFDRRSSETPLASAETLRASLARHRARYFVVDAAHAPLAETVGTLVSSLGDPSGGTPLARLYLVSFSANGPPRVGDAPNRDP
jgi:hypothetical protein